MCYVSADATVSNSGSSTTTGDHVDTASTTNGVIPNKYRHGGAGIPDDPSQLGTFALRELPSIGVGKLKNRDILAPVTVPFGSGISIPTAKKRVD